MVAINRLMKNGQVIEQHDLHPTFSNSHDFEIVETYPQSYKIWNIGRRNFDFKCYIPLCSCTNDGSCVNTDTLKALKVPSEKIALELMEQSAHGSGDYKSYKALLNSYYSTEFYYDNGTVSVNVLDGNEHVSIEFFPNEQDKDSFERADYDNVMLIDNFMNGNFTGYEYNTPNDITDEEIERINNLVREFLQNLKDFGLTK